MNVKIFYRKKKKSRGGFFCFKCSSLALILVDRSYMFTRMWLCNVQCVAKHILTHMKLMHKFLVNNVTYKYQYFSIKCINICLSFLWIKERVSHLTNFSRHMILLCNSLMWEKLNPLLPMTTNINEAKCWKSWDYHLLNPLFFFCRDSH